VCAIVFQTIQKLFCAYQDHILMAFKFWYILSV